MDLTRLRHILAVARTGSFSRAAEEEGITQPALSRSIAAFEQRHGVVLFDRGRGGAHPTPAGGLVIDQAHKLLAASSDLERSLRLYGLGEAGRVALGVGPLVASLLLPTLGETLLRTRPGLQILAAVRTPDLLLSDLLADRIEMIVGNNWHMTNVPGIDTRVLANLRLAPMVRSGHPLAQRKGLTVADLADFPTASAVELPASIGAPAGAFVCDNYHILRETVLRTDCVWLSSAAFVLPELEARLLVNLDVSDAPKVESEVCLLTRRGRTRSPAAIIAENEIESLLARASGMAKNTDGTSIPLPVARAEQFTRHMVGGG